MLPLKYFYECPVLALPVHEELLPQEGGLVSPLMILNGWEYSSNDLTIFSPAVA
jgi:hypothetical protein